MFLSLLSFPNARRLFYKHPLTPVYLSKATFEKQNKHTLNQTIYLRLEDFLGTAEWHKGVKDKHHTIIGHDDGQLMVAILKVTKDAKEVYLQSYRRTDDRQVQSWRKRMQR